jgi:type III restriction enzyme
VAAGFFEQPILNSPYEAPTPHHDLAADGQPLNAPPLLGRRRSELLSPVPASKKKGKKGRQADREQDLFAQEDEEGQTYTLNFINEIRTYVTNWRNLPNPSDWGVTPVTERLLKHWRDPSNFATVRPFFCQVEAVETAIWLTEVAPKQRQHAHLWEHVRSANAAANPELIRIALKLATGAGKTNVMAMLIAWQTLNAARSTSPIFSRAFLIVTPGITIRDRMQILLPSHPDNYYASRELVRADMLLDLAKAKIVLTNYHAFKRRETMELSKVGKGLLQGRGDPIQTTETEGAMLKRACGELLAFKQVVVINDEAHHCCENASNIDPTTEASQLIEIVREN